MNEMKELTNRLGKKKWLMGALEERSLNDLKGNLEQQLAALGLALAAHRGLCLTFSNDDMPLAVDEHVRFLRCCQEMFEKYQEVRGDLSQSAHYRLFHAKLYREVVRKYEEACLAVQFTTLGEIQALNARVNERSKLTLQDEEMLRVPGSWLKRIHSRIMNWLLKLLHRFRLMLGLET